MGRVTVRSTVELRRRNLQVVFKQRLLVPSAAGARAAGAEVAEVTAASAEAWPSILHTTRIRSRHET